MRGFVTHGAMITVAAVAVALAGPSAAGAVTFGADLNAHPANSNALASCSAGLSAFPSLAGSTSCMYSYLGTGSDSLVAPASGRVTAVRVKIGSTTGPMGVNVIRFLFRQNPGDPSHPTSAGPFLEAYGPQFTPAANAITTVPTSLTMREDPTPHPDDGTTIQVIDALALEVRGGSIPLPLFESPGSLVYPIYPGPSAAGVPAPSPNALPSYTNIGAGVLMSADLTAGEPEITLPRTTIPVRGGVAPVPLQCQGAACAGLLQLLRATGTARGTAARTVSYGSARFSIAARGRATVKVKLNSSGRALLKHRRRATVKARVTFSSGGGTARSFTLTLKR